jgi:DNA-binding response OmpR family regulator
MSDTVLIVDDSLTVRMDLAEAFGSAGFQPVPCASVREARDALAEKPADVIVLDVLLPDGDGVALLKELRATPAGGRAVVLMLSSEAEVKDRIRGLQTGADEYVGKPYDAGYVVSKSRELLRARQAPADGARHILLIDDSRTFREEMRRALEAEGHRVSVAPTGEDGLRAAADQRPSAIVVDGTLPGIDGSTVIRRVRLDAALRSIPCLLLTASEDESAELGALDAGADAFVRKGEDASLVLAKLAALLRRPAAPIPVDATSSLLSPKKILAVDDSRTYLQELATSLRGEGYDLSLAHSGEEALDLLAVQPVDCVLLDLVMPGLGGQETCRRIKAAPIVRDIPLIILTGVDDRTAMIESLSIGADDYIPKSSDFEVLKARVRAQIRRKQFEDENRHIREELLRKEMAAAEARAAQELAETRASLVEELERKNDELEAFSYSVSHDLRAPLRAIDGFSQILLEEHAAGLDEKAGGYLKRVRQAAKRMSELIEDLLKLSRVSSGDLVRQRVDISTIARTVAADLQLKDMARQVTFEAPESAVGDVDGRLVRVLLENLIGNAWKFTTKVAEPRIEFGLEARRPGGPTYFVRDNGAGFSMAHAEKLFRPFQRLHSDAEFPGTGIGLATVYRIVDRHGGRIWAEGEVGRGATFFFTLQRTPRAAAAPAGEADERPPRPEIGGRA